MNKNKGITETRLLRINDIIDYAAIKGSVRSTGSRDLTKGLVHHVVYDAQEQVIGFYVFEIAPSDIARQSGYPIFPLNTDGTGLPKGEWSVVIEPIKLENKATFFGRDNEYTYQYGSIDTLTEDNLTKFIEAHGGEEKLFRHYLDYAQIRGSKWDDLNTFNRERHATSDDFAFKAPEKIGKKRAYKKKGGESTYVVDLSFEHVVDRLNIDPALIKLFTHPKGNIKPLSSLRELRDIVYERPQELEKFLPKEKHLKEDITWSALEQDLFPAVYNGLQEPKNPQNTPVIKTLQQAFDLVSQRPEELTRYKYMGPSNSKLAIEEITALYKRHAVNHIAEDFSVGKIARQIKNAWSILALAYQQHSAGQPAPEVLANEAGQPLWYKRKLTP